MSSPRFSLITTSMGRLQHLQQSLPSLLTQPDSEVIVVDYSCPEGTGDWLLAQRSPARVVRVPGQARFNLSRARNAGAAAARGAWFCFIDADVVASPNFLPAVSRGLDQACFYRNGSPNPELAGTFLCPATAFQAIGGYDDVIEGWGGEDRDLYWRLRTCVGLAESRYPDQLLQPIHHGDELRTKHHANQNLRQVWTTNCLYIELKMDLIRLGGRDLDREVREKLFAEVQREVLQADAEGRDVKIEFSGGWNRLASGQKVEHRLVLSLQPTGPQAGLPAPNAS